MAVKEKIKNFIQNLPIHIGMRTFKTWLSATVTGLIAVTPIIGNPFYALMGSVLGVQSTVADSFQLGVGRIVGTALGATIGFIFAYFGLTSPPLIALAIAAVIIISGWLRIRHSIMITVTLCLLIIFNPTPEGGLVLYASFRTLDTSIGVVVGLLINRFVAPPNHLKNLVAELEALYDVAKNAHTDSQQLPVLQEEIVKLTFHHSNYQADEKYDNHDISNANLRRTIEICNDLYFHLKNITVTDVVIANYHTEQIDEIFVTLKDTIDLLKEAI